MKYKEVKKIQTNGGVDMTSHGLFLIKIDNEQKEIIHFHKDGNKCEKYNLIDMSEIYRLYFANDYLIVSFKNGTTSFYKYNKQNVCKFDKQLHFSLTAEDGIHIYIETKEMLYQFNKQQYTIKPILLVDKYTLLSCVFDDNIVFRKKGGQIFLYKNHPDAIQLVWQLDVTSLFPDQEDIRISEIKEYQGSLIVLTSVATLRLSTEDGSVIWINNGYAHTLEIVGNIGYVCTGLSLLKINLDNGEESGYGWECHELPNFIYEGKNYWPIGHRVIYHEDLLWYSVYSSGHSFLLAINPENGNYEWIHHVDTYEKTEAPQFYEDKMFLWDTGNTLHIYEKE